MSEEAVVLRSDEPVPDGPIAADMTLIARDPAQLQFVQRRLITWCDAKIDETVRVITELETQIEHHRSHKWNFSALRSALKREKERDLFYTKVRAALDAGFYIVPNFPCSIFAIRTQHEAAGEASSQWGQRSAMNSLPQQPADVLEIGDGDYENPDPKGTVRYVDTSDPKKTTHHAMVTGYKPIDFPFAFAKPEVLTATQQAMALKIFDELAVLPGKTKKVDPMIIGRIIRPWQRSKWDSDQNMQRHLSFLVVWWLDTVSI